MGTWENLQWVWMNSHYKDLGQCSVRGRCFKFTFHLFKILIDLNYLCSSVNDKFITQPIIKWWLYSHLVSSHGCDGGVMTGDLANITRD